MASSGVFIDLTGFRVAREPATNKEYIVSGGAAAMNVHVRSRSCAGGVAA